MGHGALWTQIEAIKSSDPIQLKKAFDTAQANENSKDEDGSW